jgi:hypothetical protein
MAGGHGGGGDSGGFAGVAIFGGVALFIVMAGYTAGKALESWLLSKTLAPVTSQVHETATSNCIMQPNGWCKRILLVGPDWIAVPIDAYSCDGYHRKGVRYEFKVDEETYTTYFRAKPGAGMVSIPYYTFHYQAGTDSPECGVKQPAKRKTVPHKKERRKHIDVAYGEDL